MKVQNDLKGYYAHMTAIDDCIGQLRKTLKDQGLDKNTILVFTSDHGDLMGSHGAWNKQQPYDESIRVPFLIHYPKALGIQGRTSKVLLNSLFIIFDISDATYYLYYFLFNCSSSVS
jgi:arylsulfatase A-like enzyme